MEKTSPVVSVIIINYNTFALTCSCIESVIRFTKGIPVEILLVDNASTECDPQEFRLRFPSVQLIVSPANLGFAGGNNAALPSAKGEYILLLNSDTELREDSILFCLEKLRADENTGAVSCRLVFPDGKVQHQCYPFPSLWREFFQLTRLVKLLPAGYKSRRYLGTWFNHNTSCETDWLWGTFFMFPRKALSSFPGKKLPETHFMYGEDMEWCYLIRRSGLKIRYEAGTTVLHHMGASSGSGKSKLMFAGEKKFITAHYGNLFWKIYRRLRLMNYRVSIPSNPVYRTLFDELSNTK